MAKKKLNLGLVEAAEPSTTAKKSKTTKRDFEIGDTGTQILKGIVNEEYNSKLRDIEGIKVYDEMRASDGTVKATVLAVSLPIRRAKWLVTPASEDEADKEIATFVQGCLFEHHDMGWNDLIRQVLTYLPLGVMVFEKVFDVKTIDGVDRIIWSKFAPRLPKSIRAWEMTNGEAGIQQYLPSGETVDIPMDKLLIFVNEMEGKNWWGVSILRAAYKHWYIKNNLYKIDAIASERQGLGIPYAKLSAGYTEAERAKAEVILKNIRAHQQAFIIEIADQVEFGFKDMMARTTRDLNPSISHHNREITKGVLAQFLELGATDSGSRALSTDQSDLFLQSLEAVASHIADIFNTYAIKQLVDFNFPGVTNYPKLTFTGITRGNIAELATAYQGLITSGGIKAGENDEPYLRELMGLPERDQSEDGVEDKSQEEDMVPKIDPTTGEQVVDDAGNPVMVPKSQAQANPKNEDGMDMSEHHHHHSHKKKVFADGSFRPFRKLTFAEEKVDFSAIQSAMDKLESQFDSLTQELLHQARDEYMQAFTRAANDGDTQAIKNITLKVKNDYARIIKNAFKNAFEYGKTNAAQEISVNAPANPSAMLQQIDIQANAIADQHITEIVASSKSAYTQALAKGASVPSALAAADAAAADAIDTLTSDTSSITMAGYINHGRDTVFEKNMDDIYALQRSELLDSATCNYCLSVDGRVVERDDPFAKNTIFHSNCRGIWVAILLNESELPKIDGIPQSIKDRFGGDVNDLLQPNVPKTKKDSLARQEVEKRLKREANK